MIRAAGAAVALTFALWASIAQARFAPVEDHRYRYEIDETRVAGGVTHRFHARRSIVFHRTVSGFDAVVTLEVVRHSPAGDVGAMFQATTGALLQRAVRFRLDARGHVTQVDDADRAVALIADAIERLGTARRDRPPRLAPSRMLAAPLRSATPERKTAMLVSILQPVVLSDEADRAAGSRAVVLPNRPPLPAGAGLTGSETIVRDDPASVTITLQAAGSVVTTLPNASSATAGVTIRQTRRIDAVSGLLRDSVETSETTLSGTGDARRASTTTVVHVALEQP